MAICTLALLGPALVAVGPTAAAPLVAQVSAEPAVTTGPELVARLSSGNLTIELAAGTIQISSALSITRAGTRLVGATDGSSVIQLVDEPRTRVINVTSAAKTATIERVTVTGGANTNGSGGGINVESGATLTLKDSTVTGNVARDGGGINNDGSIRIENSTIDNNAAERKGGGLRDNGPNTRIINSTFVANIASQGGAVSTTGSTDITHATIVRNQSTSSSSAGLDRNGGTLKVRYSIIGANTRDNGSAAADCSGTPELIGLNLISNSSGCNPVGPIIVGAPGVGALANNGGPTKTAALLDSAALDKIELDANNKCVSGVDLDQRGTQRPFGTKCDLGAFERSQLGVAVALDVDTRNYPGLGNRTVEVGLTSLEVDDILEELVQPTSGSIADTALRSIALRSIALRSITVEDIALRSIAPKATALRSIALRSIALRSIALRSIALRSIALRSIALRSIPLSEIPLTEDADGATLLWQDVLAGTAFQGVPLQSITLEDLVSAQIDISNVTLASIDLSSTALRSIALRSILLQDVALRSIQVGDLQTDGDYADAWCAVLGDLCGTGPDQLTVGEVGDADLLTIQLAGGNVDDVPIYDIPLSGLASTALRSIDLEDTALRSIALRSIALRSIYIENTALRSIALRSIALRSIGSINSLVDCGAYPEYCSTAESNEFTLGDVPEAALIGNVGSLVDLPADLLDGLSFGDLLLAFAPPEASPWEKLDLENARLQNIGKPAQPTFEYVAKIDVKESAADLAVTLTLPPGFALATLPGETATFDGVPVTRTTGDLGVATFTIGAAGVGTHELRVPARAGLVTGASAPSNIEVVASSGAQQANASSNVVVNVVAAGDPNGDSIAVPTLGFGDLRLAHVSSNDDADLYEFTVTGSEAGNAARILLSNIPDDVDYDLAVYERETDPLRVTEPTERLASVGEVRYDLNPTDDVYPTDIVNDIAIDVPSRLGIAGYTPRDISSRRSNADEEVKIPALKAGTYYVAVTSYLGSSSDKPYGLRLRIDDTDTLPECRSGSRWDGVDLPSTLTVPAAPGAPAKVNTLYITNTQWLAGEVGVDEATAIIAAADNTTGTNGVVAKVVALDADTNVAAAYAEWARAANRCSPDARNDVVREIGKALDELVDEDVENIVILGGDGVVPMAAVPDRTAYSNETTFARDVLTDGGKSNEVAGTLGAGYLLSDDPYASDTGIEINGADHELYVPTRAIGRLVEDGPQILSQLKNFVTYGGRLDPATLPGLGEATATVTGYDFLSDGADAVADALTAGIAGVDDSLNNETWDRDAYLALFGVDASDPEAGGSDIISPNAHYDFESLLPAANDGTYFEQGDLVSTGDFTGSNDFRLPDRSVVFSMGCHAGLSVSDVQLGVTALDWAELYADGDNPWLAHTTYGYGDTEIVAYSERLAELFAQQLVASGDGSGSLGDAVRIAKQDYLASTLVLSPYDEKILQSFTYYGLPMYTVGGPERAQPSAGALVDQSSESELVVDSPATFGKSIPGTLDRTPVTVAVSEGSESGPTNLNLETTDDGNYYEVDGNTVTAQYRPVQPLVDAEIPETVGPTAGFLITGLTSKDVSAFTPRYLRPTVDLDANERRVEPADGSFPASLQRVTTDGSGGQRLLLAAGQFEAKKDAPDGTGRQRLFTSIRGELYERGPNSDGVGPGFSDITGNIETENDGVVFFQIDTDARTPAQRVVVVYREGANPQWRSLDLFRSTTGGSTWVGGFRPISTDPVEFFVQAVDADGDVAISSNKVENFFTSPPVESGDLEIELKVIEPTTSVNGYYTGPVTFEILSPNGTDALEYSVDAQPFAPYNPNATPIVSGDGGHVVFARDSSGSQQFLYFVIDGSGPTITAERSPDVEWANGNVDVLFRANDVGQAGVAYIEYSASGATPISATRIEGDQGSVTITANGITTITATAYDNSRNKSEPVEITVQIDKDGPVFDPVVVTPAAGPSGWSKGPATVTLSATDAGAGVGRIDYVLDGGEITTYTTPIVPAEGISIITATAYDVLGNDSDPDTSTVKVDASLPVVTADLPTLASVGQQVNLVYSCSDALSGLDPTTVPTAEKPTGCQVKIGGQPLAATTVPAAVIGKPNTWQVPIDAGTTIGTKSITITATDYVGFVTPVTKTLRVGYRICPLYDVTQAKNIGSNYTIKIQFCDQAGKVVKLANNAKVTALTVDALVDPGPTFSGNSNDGYEFRLTRGDSSYTYNLNTTGLGAGTHQLYFTNEPVICPTPTPALPRGCTLSELQARATHSAEFRLQ